MIPEFDSSTPNTVAPANGKKSDVALPKAEPINQGAIAVGPFAVNVDLSLDTWHSGYTATQFESARVSQTRLTPDQAVALKLLALSLNKQGARMSNGRFVECSTDAVRYLLDQVAAKIPADVIKKLIG